VYFYILKVVIIRELFGIEMDHIDVEIVLKNSR